MTDIRKHDQGGGGGSVAADMRSGETAFALLGALAHARHRLWLYPLVAGVVIVAVSFLLPNEYRATVTILPPEGNFQSMSGQLGLAQGLLGGEMSLPLMSTPSDILAAVLTSRTARDSVITRLHLTDRWDITHTKALVRLYKSTTVDVKETGVIYLSVKDRDRYFADTLANAAVRAADRLNQTIANSKARRTREFVEARLAETQVSLQRATAALEAFQNEHRTVALDVEIAALVENAAGLRARMTADEIELSILEESLAPEHQRIRAMQTRIAETRRKLRDLESPADDSLHSFMGAGLQELPRLAQQLAALLRDVKMAETLYELLAQQYENARIQEQKDTPTFSVLDWAEGGGAKAWPKRLLLGIAVGISTFGFFMLFLLAREYLVIIEQRDPARYQAITKVWQALRGTRNQGGD